MLLMRHASAGERLESPDRDRARALDAAGRGDARGLARAFAEYDIQRIVSSPTARCVATVLTLARRRGLEVECRDELGPHATRQEATALLRSLPDSTLVCTHREIFERLYGGAVTCEKGGTWLVERQARRRVPVPVAYLPPPSGGVPLKLAATGSAEAARPRGPARARRSRL